MGSIPELNADLQNELKVQFWPVPLRCSIELTAKSMEDTGGLKPLLHPLDPGLLWGLAVTFK